MIDKKWIKPLRQIGGGLIWILLDIRFGTIDLLPDFIGYLIAAAGLRQLRQAHAAFGRAAVLAWILALISLPDTVLESYSLSMTDMSFISLRMLAYGQALTLLHVLMAYWILEGCLSLARQGKAAELADSIIRRRRIYLAWSALQLILYPFLLNLSISDVLLAFAAVGIVGFMLAFLLLRIPFRLSKLKPWDDERGRVIDWKV